MSSTIYDIVKFVLILMNHGSCNFQTKSNAGNKSNNNADSSGEDDSDDEEEQQKETHDEVSCDRNFMVITFNLFSFDFTSKQHRTFIS